MAPRTSIDEKIAMLLRKAESTDSAHEAEALSAAAEKLMIKHSIEMAQLDLNPKHKDTDPIVHKIVAVRGIYATSLESIISGAVTALGARAYYVDKRRHSGGMEVHIVDFKSTIDHAERLANSLVQQGENAMKSWWKTNRGDYYTGSQGFKARRSFLRGFGVGAANRIREERKDALDDTRGAGELVLARDEKLESVLSDIGVVVGTRREQTSRNALQDGWAEGKKASLQTTAGSVTR